VPLVREAHGSDSAESFSASVSFAFGLDLGRFLFAVGDVPPAAFEHDAGGLNQPADAALAFRAARERSGRKALSAVKADAALLASVGV